MNFLRNPAVRQRLAFGTGLLAVGGILYGVEKYLQQQRERSELLLKQKEKNKTTIKELEIQLTALKEDKELLKNECQTLKTRNEVLKKELDKHDEGKRKSVKEFANELEGKILFCKLQANGQATRNSKLIDQNFDDQSTTEDVVSCVSETDDEMVSCEDYLTVSENEEDMEDYSSLADI